MSAGYNYQSSFATGEIDPAIWDRTNLERHRNALRTAENVYIGRTGRVISRQGTSYYGKPKVSHEESVFYIPKSNDYMLEVGVGYFRIHDLLTGVITDVVDPLINYTASEIRTIKFSSTKDFVYIYCTNHDMIRVLLGPLNPLNPELNVRFKTLLMDNLNFNTTGTSGVGGAATGYETSYFASVIVDNEESLEKPVSLSVQTKLPVAYTEIQDFTFTFEIPNAMVSKIKHAYIYRAPKLGNAPGFLGIVNITSIGTVGPLLTPVTFRFIDYGIQADYSHLPPTMQEDFSKDILRYHTGPGKLVVFQPPLGIVYQERHVVVGTTPGNQDQVFASRSVNMKNFYRDYPP